MGSLRPPPLSPPLPWLTCARGCLDTKFEWHTVLIAIFRFRIAEKNCGLSLLDFATVSFTRAGTLPTCKRAVPLDQTPHYDFLA